MVKNSWSGGGEERRKGKGQEKEEGRRERGWVKVKG